MATDPFDSAGTTDEGSSCSAVAARDPGRPAIVTPAGAVLSFGALDARVNAISHHLRALGLGTGDVVAAVVPNGAEYVELVLATAQVGMYLVPVNRHLAPPEIAFVVADSGAQVLVAGAGSVPGLPADALPRHRFTIGGAPAGCRPYAELGAGYPSSAPEGRTAGAVMAYTSGTTGRPKGVRRNLPGVPPEAALTRAQGLLLRYGARPGRGVHLVCSPMYHAAPGSHAVGFLHLGHTLVVQDSFDAETFLRDVAEHGVRSTHMVPTHFHRLLALPEATRRRYDTSTLKIVAHAGAPCPVDVKRRMLEEWGPVLWEYLGSTEGVVTLVSPQEWPAKPGTVGRPLPGTVVRIVRDDGTEAAAGEPGTIYFGVEGVPPSFSYHGDPQKTAESRRGNLVTAGDTGLVDDDGYVFLLDRRTDLVITGGVNVYPAEVEQHLLTHPAVHDTAVVGLPDPEWGQSVLAVVQPAPGIVADDALRAELDAHCRTGLAAFKRPRRIDFVADLPRTESGKLQRRRVRELFAEPLPDA
ncbi:AMP-binding protein [Trujillonella endophytica]|uniref:Long-chain acyl-CoA synthetase n=1 Tax=Trujillonella endophytica TaxID=673521 RepID=A0A1H8VVS6_9ACTN|nr:AMP-binding protein [Trujillella endophytica]SEP19506.1 long-chain acyl-CoA synthetase [Trujillella endophytica]